MERGDAVSVRFDACVLEREGGSDWWKVTLTAHGYTSTATAPKKGDAFEAAYARLQENVFFGLEREAKR